MPRILVLQHHEVETPGVFGEVLAERDFFVHTVRLDLAEPVPPDPDGFAGLVVMGGPMSVYEGARYPWLEDEDRLIRGAIRSDLPTLGVCLGSQLIAKAAGASVAPGPEKEIGWYPLRLSAEGRRDPVLGALPERFEAFEWHGDVFDLPPGAVSLAASALYPLQAFRLGRRVYGLLFHLEVTGAMVRRMAEAFRDELAALRDAERVRRLPDDVDGRAAAAGALARRVFTGFLALLDA